MKKTKKTKEVEEEIPKGFHGYSILDKLILKHGYKKVRKAFENDDKK